MDLGCPIVVAVARAEGGGIPPAGLQASAAMLRCVTRYDGGHMGQLFEMPHRSLACSSTQLAHTFAGGTWTLQQHARGVHYPHHECNSMMEWIL